MGRQPKRPLSILSRYYPESRCWHGQVRFTKFSTDLRDQNTKGISRHFRQPTPRSSLRPGWRDYAFSSSSILNFNPLS